MKKILALLLAVLLLLSLAACEKKAEAPTASATPEATLTPEPEITPEPTEGTAELPPYTETRNSYGFDTGANLAPTVIYDSDDLTITANGLEYSDEDGTVNLLLSLTNKSDGQQSYSLEEASVNRFMNSSFMLEFAEAGETKDVQLDFSYSRLMTAGIDCISEIVLYGFSFTDEEWNTTTADPITIRTNAYGAAADVTDCYDFYTAAETQQKFDYPVTASARDTVEIAPGVYANAEFYSFDEYTKEIVFQLYNDTEEAVEVHAAHLKLNDLLTYSAMSYVLRLMPGTRGLLSATLTDGVPAYCFDELEFDPVAKVDVTLRLNDEEEGVEYTFLVPNTVQDEAPDGDKVYDKDGVTVYSLGLEDEGAEDYIGFTSLLLLLKNTTGKTLEISDNGYESLLLDGNPIDFESRIYTVKDGETVVLCYNIWDIASAFPDMQNMDEIRKIDMALNIAEKGANEIPEQITLSILED